MSEWFASGLVIDAILAAVLLESFLLVWLGKRRALPVLAWLPSLLAGAALLIAVRLAVAGAEWSWIAGVLALAGLAHVYDLMCRLEPQG